MQKDGWSHMSNMLKCLRNFWRVFLSFFFVCTGCFFSISLINSLTFYPSWNNLVCCLRVFFFIFLSLKEFLCTNGHRVIWGGILRNFNWQFHRLIVYPPKSTHFWDISLSLWLKIVWLKEESPKNEFVLTSA